MKDWWLQIYDILQMVLIFSSFGAALGWAITAVVKRLWTGLLVFFAVAVVLHWWMFTRSGQWNDAIRTTKTAIW